MDAIVPVDIEITSFAGIDKNDPLSEVDSAKFQGRKVGGVFLLQANNGQLYVLTKTFEFIAVAGQFFPVDRQS